MSDLEIHESEVLAISGLGTVVSLQAPQECARALADVRHLEQQLRDIKAALTQALVEESRRQGTKTLELGSVKAEIRGGSEVLWDSERLETDLRALGCPDEVLGEILKTTVTVSVDVRRAERAAKANPEYAAVIQSARSEVEKAPYVVLRSER